MEKWFFLFNKWISYNGFLWSEKSRKELWQKFVKAIKDKYNIKTEKINWRELDFNKVGKDLCEYYLDENGVQHDGIFILDNMSGLWKENK